MKGFKLIVLQLMLVLGVASFALAGCKKKGAQAQGATNAATAGAAKPSTAGAAKPATAAQKPAEDEKPAEGTNNGAAAKPDGSNGGTQGAAEPSDEAESQ